MGYVYDKAITVQVKNAETEAWANALSLHARINHARGDVRLRADAAEYSAVRTFDVRWTHAVDAIVNGAQLYRILYRGQTYRVLDADDFEERHEHVRITGEVYDG